MSDIPFALLLVKMAAMFVVMGMGWWMRRSDWLSPATISSLSRLTIEVAFPCFTVEQMLRTLDRQAMQQSVPLLLMGVGMMLLSAGVGLLLASGVRGDERRRTAAFLIAVPNWIFLPLPLAQAVGGEAGVRTVLLLNVPAQLALWTLNLAMLRGTWSGARGWRGVASNTGLLATITGIALALFVPGSLAWPTEGSAPGVLVQGMGLLGSMTMPLSLLITGAQLADTRLVQSAPALLARVLAGRLLVAPVLCALAIELGGRWVGLDELTRLVAVLVFAMPVAVSCVIFVERFGGDRDLASQGFLYSTLASLLSMPIVVALVGWLR